VVASGTTYEAARITNTAPIAENHGLRAESSNATNANTGIWTLGTGGNYATGIYASGSNGANESVGVEAKASGSPINYGVHADLNLGSTGNYLALYGNARAATTGANYGVYGAASGAATNWAGYFASGDVYIQNNLGIGVTSASEKLDVSGNVEVTGEYKYASAKTQYYSVSAAAFNLTDGNSTTYVSGFASGNSKWVSGGVTTSDAVLTAPINLPNGCTFTNLQATVWDTDGTYEVSMELVRVTLGSTTVSTLSTTTSSGTTYSSGITNLTSSTSVTIDNATYAYYLKFNTKQSNSSLRIINVKITYTVDKVD
jgi:hypothetical protein